MLTYYPGTHTHGQNEYWASFRYPIKTSNSKISWSFEAARFVFWIVQLLWNLTGSAALLPMCLSNFKTIRQLELLISRLRGFTGSYDKASYRILKRAAGGYCDIGYPHETPLKRKSREILLTHNIHFICRIVFIYTLSTSVILPCSMQNFTTICQMSNKLWANEI